ncbi:MAG: hypothetical protein ACLS9N_13265 [[Clostridium] leptum]
MDLCRFREMDSIGGQMNAYTTAVSPAPGRWRNMWMGVDIMSDMVVNPLIPRT